MQWFFTYKISKHRDNAFALQKGSTFFEIEGNCRRSVVIVQYCSRSLPVHHHLLYSDSGSASCALIRLHVFSTFLTGLEVLGSRCPALALWLSCISNLLQQFMEFTAIYLLHFFSSLTFKQLCKKSPWPSPQTQKPDAPAKPTNRNPEHSITLDVTVCPWSYL